MKEIIELEYGSKNLRQSEIVALPAAMRATLLTRPKGFYRDTGKRAFDLALTTMLSILLLPVIFVLWVLVRLDGGPGFYSQMRVGLNGQVFRCWKLRTMQTDADATLQRMCDENPEIAREWHEKQKLEVDPRITPIGRILRATSIDELPQILNILMGHMSLVGPRPFIDHQADLYDRAGGRSYYTVRPGITGTWQVFGRGHTTFVDRVKYDTLYCRDISMWKDLFLMYKTVGVVLRRKGT
jgi:exopolysaccharide production protein ExoY